MIEYFQSQWKDMIEESAYTVSAFAEHFNFSYQTLGKWLRCDVSPRHKNVQKMEEALKKAKEIGRIPWHPSYGYATEAQISRLKEIGLCPEYHQIMKTIAKQNEVKGKIYF